MTDVKKRKGAPKKNFSHDEIDSLIGEYRQIPEELMMAVDKGFSEVLCALQDSIFYQSDSLTSLDCLKPQMHKKLQDFARVVKHRKVWYARLEVIKGKSSKQLSILERQALSLDGIEGREAYILLQKALKACVDADENKAKELDLAKRFENRAESLKKRADGGTSITAERRARTARLCFYGGLLEAFCELAAQREVGFIQPIYFFRALAKGNSFNEAVKQQMFELLDKAQVDKRNPFG